MTFKKKAAAAAVAITLLAGGSIAAASPAIAAPSQAWSAMYSSSPGCWGGVIGKSFALVRAGYKIQHQSCSGVVGGRFHAYILYTR